MDQFYGDKRYSGQGMMEYALIGALVAIVIIASLTQLGSNLNGQFDNILGKPKPLNVISSQQVSTSSKDVSISSNNQGSGLKFTTAKGSVIDLPDYPHSLGQTVATTGANGATNVLADTLTSVADQLLASGEISQTQYNSLIDLANKGHNLATVEGKFETIASESSSSDEMYTKIQQDPDLSYKNSNGGYYFTIGYAGTDNDPTKLTDPLTQRGAVHVQEFLDVYNSVLNNGSLQDPAVKQVVSGLVANIGYLANAVGTISGQVVSGDQSLDQLTAQTAAYMTNQDSAGICAAGQGTDSGFQCSG